jgi:hypothetical protein
MSMADREEQILRARQQDFYPLIKEPETLTLFLLYYYYYCHEYAEHGHKLRILKIRDNIVKIEKVVKRLRND